MASFQSAAAKAKMPNSRVKTAFIMWEQGGWWERFLLKSCRNFNEEKMCYIDIFN